MSAPPDPLDHLSPVVRARHLVLNRLGPAGDLARRARGPSSAALQARIVALESQVAGVDRAQRAAADQVAEALAHARAELDALRAGTAEALAHAQRAYERAQRWDDRLAALRDTPEYEQAYTEDEPLVSARVATWNRGGLLVDRALASLRRQTYERWECVIVGDGCTDDTDERVAALGDPRIRFENLPDRASYPADPTHAWQVWGTQAAVRSLALAQGLWTAQLDDDDEWDDDHLEVLLAHARQTRGEFIYGRWRMRDATSGALIDRELGSWPPRHAQIAGQAALEHGILRHLPPDPLAYLADEPGDWHRFRRLLEAGTRFAHLERAVSTVWYTPKTDEQRAALAGEIATHGIADEPGRPSTGAP